MFQPKRRRRRARYNRRASRPNVELMLETLEALLLSSASPWDAAYESWRHQTFSIGSIETTSVSAQVDASAAGGASAYDAAALGMIGVAQTSQLLGYTGAGYTVAIIDTGVQYTHSAFAGRYLGGYDWVDDDADPMDLNGHGTHVAGIVASANATYRGVAPGAGIVALRVLDANGSGSFGDVELALQWVIAHRQQFNIVAINMSLGSGNFTTNPYTFLDDELQTLKNQGVFTAAAAGNSFYTYGSQQGLGYPAISGLTVAVGAVYTGSYGTVNWGSGAQDTTTAVDRIASFSQRSAALDILAPGAMIASTYLNGGYTSMAGTSMAAPFVAGAAIVMRQALDANGRSSQAGQDSMLAMMQNTGARLVDGDDENDNVINTGLSFRRLNLGAALASITSGTTPAPPPPTSPTLTPNAQYLQVMFQHLLGRGVDVPARNALSASLDAGMPRTQLTYSLWISPEHRAQQIDNYYSTYLGRMPALGERDAWIRAFQAGAHETTMIRSFLNSAEYSNRFPTNSAFVSQLYQHLLLRPPDTAGLAAWTGALNAGTPRSQLVEGFLNSSERLLRIVDRHYQDYLGRPAGEPDRAYWLSMLQTGRLTLGQLSQLILASQEYYNRCVAGAFQGPNQPRALGATSEAIVAPPAAGEAAAAYLVRADASRSPLGGGHAASLASESLEVPTTAPISRPETRRESTVAIATSLESPAKIAARVQSTIKVMEKALDAALDDASEDELDEVLTLLARRRGLA